MLERRTLQRIVRGGRRLIQWLEHAREAPGPVTSDRSDKDDDPLTSVIWQRPRARLRAAMHGLPQQCSPRIAVDAGRSHDGGRRVELRHEHE